MKEKIKKMFQYICTWKFVMWLNIACVVYHIVGFLVTGDALYCAGIAWNAGYALVCYCLQKYEDRHQEDMFCVVSLDYHFGNCLVQLNRYKTRYGELPPDAPSVQPQQPSEESEQPQAETQQADAPSVADIPEESLSERIRKANEHVMEHVRSINNKTECATQPSVVSKKPRNINRKPRSKSSSIAKVDAPSPKSKAEKPKRPTINPGTSHRTSSAAPKKPRTKKDKEEQV